MTCSQETVTLRSFDNFLNSVSNGSSQLVMLVYRRAMLKHSLEAI